MGTEATGRSTATEVCGDTYIYFYSLNMLDIVKVWRENTVTVITATVNTASASRATEDVEVTERLFTNTIVVSSFVIFSFRE